MADEKKMQPLSYLMRELNGQKDFTQEWKRLTEPEKVVLRQWAQEEMDTRAAEGTL
jgi:hypothetical protein